MFDKSGRGAIRQGYPPDRHRKIAPASRTDPVPSPDVVVWEIGRVIAVCLGLAVAANLLVVVLPGP